MLTPLPTEQRAQGELFYLMPMPRVPYIKPAISYADKYPNIDPAAMGFTSTWMDEQLWQ